MISAGVQTSRIIFTNNIIENNQLSLSNDKVLANFTSSFAKISNNKFTGNTTGGIISWNGAGNSASAELKRNLISGNILDDSFEDGINMQGKTRVTVSENEISTDLSSPDSYPVFINLRCSGNMKHACAQGEVHFLNNRIYNVNAQDAISIGAFNNTVLCGAPKGGIIYFSGNIIHDTTGRISFDTLETSFSNNLLYDNSEPVVGASYWAHFMGIRGTFIPLLNSTFANNQGDIWVTYRTGAGAITSNIEINNSIFWNSPLAGYMGGSPASWYDGKVYYSNLASGISNTCSGTPGDCENIYDQDPWFVNSATGDLHLLAASPCIDKGDPSSSKNDPENLANPGFALDPPSKNTVRNDMGAYGGPGAINVGVPAIFLDDPGTVDIREDIIGTYAPVGPQ